MGNNEKYNENTMWTAAENNEVTNQRLRACSNETRR
jgi:hypothetical protein